MESSNSALRTYQQTQLLFRVLLEMPKEDSSFLYFILEAMDNLCFYSTLDHVTGAPERQVEITCPIEHQSTLLQVLDHLGQSLQLTKVGTSEIRDWNSI